MEQQNPEGDAGEGTALVQLPKRLQWCSRRRDLAVRTVLATSTPKEVGRYRRKHLIQDVIDGNNGAFHASRRWRHRACSFFDPEASAPLTRPPTLG